MPSPTLFGLPNCDSCKKARAWLVARNIAHEFIDYRAKPLSSNQLEKAAAALGWERLANKSSTTWRALSDEQKRVSTPADWLALLAQYPTLIRRPLLIDADHVDAGFVEARYVQHFATRDQNA